MCTNPCPWTGSSRQVLVQPLFHSSLARELLGASRELLLPHAAHWPPGTGPQDFGRAWVLKAASRYRTAWSALNKSFQMLNNQKAPNQIKSFVMS